MTDKKSSESRRKLLKKMVIGGATIAAGKSLPSEWTKPVVDSVVLPVHAQTSGVPGVPEVPEVSTVGCVDGTTEVTWSSSVHGCAGPEQTWQTYFDTQTTYCSSGWQMADSSVVNTNLVGPGYTGGSELRYAFNGEGCNGHNFFGSTGDSYSQTRASCGWDNSHHYSLGSAGNTVVQGIMCQMN